MRTDLKLAIAIVATSAWIVALAGFLLRLTGVIWREYPFTNGDWAIATAWGTAGSHWVGRCWLIYYRARHRDQRQDSAITHLSSFIRDGVAQYRTERDR